MATEYCDRYTYFQVYGCYPPDPAEPAEPVPAEPALADEEPEREVTAKVVAPEEKPPPRTSRAAKTK